MLNLQNFPLIQIACTLSTWANFFSRDLGKPYFLHGKHPITAFLLNQKGSAEGALPDHPQDCVAIHAGHPDAARLHSHGLHGFSQPVFKNRNIWELHLLSKGRINSKQLSSHDRTIATCSFILSTFDTEHLRQLSCPCANLSSFLPSQTPSANVTTDLNKCRVVSLTDRATLASSRNIQGS